MNHKLKSEGLGTSVAIENYFDSETYDDDKGWKFIGLNVTAPQPSAVEAKFQDVLKCVFQFIAFVRNQPVQKTLWEEMKILKEMEFYNLEYINPTAPKPDELTPIARAMQVKLSPLIKAIEEMIYRKLTRFH